MFYLPLSNVGLQSVFTSSYVFSEPRRVRLPVTLRCEHCFQVQLVLEYCDKGCLREALDAGVFFGREYGTCGGPRAF
jgi:hypothetical protein